MQVYKLRDFERVDTLRGSIQTPGTRPRFIALHTVRTQTPQSHRAAYLALPSPALIATTTSDHRHLFRKRRHVICGKYLFTGEGAIHTNVLVPFLPEPFAYTYYCSTNIPPLKLNYPRVHSSYRLRHCCASQQVIAAHGTEALYTSPVLARGCFS